MAWFGPKGVATMTFSLLVLGEALPGGSQIFNLAALTVFASILVHGATDTPGAEWIARVTERRRKAAEEEEPGRPPDLVGV
jgi:NhaP-type Na+/H+ or K+/H+ antiporter